ncbi:hypothetical protein [Streptomyces sp. NPDC051636]
MPRKKASGLAALHAGCGAAALSSAAQAAPVAGAGAVISDL